MYTLIHDLKHDTSIQTSDYIILQPHQLMPKYYMLSSLDRHTGILNILDDDIYLFNGSNDVL